MPLFMNLITGETYDTTKSDCVLSRFCAGIDCERCPIHPHEDLKIDNPCQTWVNAHPEEAAHLMGYKLIKEEGESNMENYIVINGKKAELTPEQLEKLGIVVKENPFERKRGEHYYCIQRTRGGVVEATDTNDGIDLERYFTANYCRNKELLEQRALHETLSRLLWRYSMLHDGDRIDWNDTTTNKWYIKFSHITNNFSPDIFCFSHVEGTVFFSSCETAKAAITEIIEPFMKEHPDFVW